MRLEEKRKGIAWNELAWWFLDRPGLLGPKGAGLEPGNAIAWDQSRIDDLHEKRVRVSGLCGSKAWDRDAMRYAESVAEKERRIGERVRRLTTDDLRVAEARWRSFGGDATLAAMAFTFRNEPGTYLGVALILAPEVEPARSALVARPRKAHLGDHVVTMPGRPLDVPTPLDVFKQLATSARRRLLGYRDDARRSWLGVVDTYAERMHG
jgi:hypothetical protein